MSTIKNKANGEQSPPHTKSTTGVDSVYCYNHYYGNKMFNSLQFRKLFAMALKVIINHNS